MSRATLCVVLLASCAHALVHVFELALPSVEQQVAAAYFPGDEMAGKRMTGLLATTWRLPWGLGALAAGWLVDRFGSKRLLAWYLLGCAAMCGLLGFHLPLLPLFVVMFSMGLFACIYHPAGLTLISHATSPVNRPLALGIHGIFGSAGIGFAPFLAGLLLLLDLSWRQYYWVLVAPGALLGVVFLRLAARESDPRSDSGPSPSDPHDEQADWRSFFTLTVFAVLQGFIYSAVLSFLPRYLSAWQPRLPGSLTGMNSYVSEGAMWTGAVLLVGCAGQFLSGALARPRILERQLALVTFANAPLLLAMAVAHREYRIAAAGAFALVHFMNQPLYNSLIAKYTPRSRRSVCYGFSFAMGLGVGGVGATFAGFSTSDRTTYAALALVAVVAGFLGIELSRRHAATSAEPAET